MRNGDDAMTNMRLELNQKEKGEKKCKHTTQKKK